jgi:hypothetical protein
LSFFSERLEPFPTSGAGRRFNPSANRRSGPAVDYLVIVGRLLNHTPLSITGQRYARPSLEALRPAMQAACDELQNRLKR